MQVSLKFLFYLQQYIRGLISNKEDIKNIKLIIGLGNPGDRYMNSRNNIAFKIIDVLANNTGIQIKTKKKKSLLGEGFFEDIPIVLLKPQTFMSLTGEAVLYIASFLKVVVKNIILIHYDGSLEFGDVAIAKAELESDNDGVKSVIIALKSHNFVRIRVGIGPMESQFSKMTPEELKEYPNNNFNLNQSMQILDIINNTEAVLRSVLTQKIDDVLSQNQFRKISV